MEKKLINVSLKEIKPYENNPRKNDDSVKYVKESIKQCGYINPIIVDENMIILAGHTRYKTLVSMKKDIVEVLQVTGLDEEKKKKFRLYDNKAGELATWDFEKLFYEVDSIDFDGVDFNWGFDGKDDSDTEFVNKEYGEENFDDEQFEYECPDCGFRFNV